MEEEVAADTILVRFRDISSIAAGTISNSDFEDKYENLALQMYNEIMDTSLTISTNTTGTYLTDEAIANLATCLAYQKIHRTKMYKDTGMLEWQRFFQNGLEVMHMQDPTKVEYIKSRDIYIPRGTSVEYRPFNKTVGRDTTGSSASTIGT
jgi:hypothetical protein|tara:strand:+ start:141 stop:593 length:453 start_codon:yes stop_codon:yes gene_type:complete